MEEGRKKIWLWLAVMMLTAMLAGGCYYFGTEKEPEHDQEGTLVERAQTGEKAACRAGKKAADTQAKGMTVTYRAGEKAADTQAKGMTVECRAGEKAADTRSEGVEMTCRTEEAWYGCE